MLKRFGGRETAATRAVFFLICVMFLLSVSSMYKKSVTYDERAGVSFGEAALKGAIIEPSMQRLPITGLNCMPEYILKKFTIRLSPSVSIFVGRLATVFASLILSVFVFMWAKARYGIRAGIFSLTLCVFCPTILAFSNIINGDIYCAALMFIATYCFIQYLNRRNLACFFISAVVTGAAQITKQTALLLFPIFIILWFFHRPHVKSNGVSKKNLLDLARRSGIFLFRFALYVVIVLLIINAAYAFQKTMRPLGETPTEIQKYSRQLNEIPHKGKAGSALDAIPIPLPLAYVKALGTGMIINETGRGHYPIYLFGKLSERGWWYYFPAAIFLKYPLSLFFMIFISILLGINRKKIGSGNDTDLLVPIIIIFSFFTFFTTCQIGIRYLLPILPFLYVFVGKIAAYEPGKRALPYRGSIYVLLAWYIASSLSYYPHYISYFNELIGDRINMYKYLADSNVDWGQDQYYLEEYIKKNKDKNIKVMPMEPTDGIIVVNINSFVGACNSNKYRWLREHYKPVGRVAYSWLIFDIPKSSLLIGAIPQGNTLRE